MEDKSKITYVKNVYPDSILISAERGININNLRDLFVDFYEHNFVEDEIRTDHTKSHLVSKVHSLVDNLETSYDDFGITIKYKTNNQIHEQIFRMFNGKK